MVQEMSILDRSYKYKRSLGKDLPVVLSGYQGHQCS